MLQAILAETLGIEPGAVDVSAKFSELGMDSLVGLRFVRKLSDSLGMPIELEWALDNPSVEMLALFLSNRFEGDCQVK